MAGTRHSNFLLVWGCRPSATVVSDTKMAQDIVKVLLTRFNPYNLSIQLPIAFEQLKGLDAEFEMVTSNTIQPTTLLYQHNIVTKKYAVIFVNTHVEGCEYGFKKRQQIVWSDAEEKASNAYRLFIKTFEFKETEVEVCTDWTKAQIIEKFDKLQVMVDEHEATNNQDVMLVSVVWIGHSLYMEKGDYHEQMKEDLLPKDNKSQEYLKNDQI